MSWREGIFAAPQLKCSELDGVSWSHLSAHETKFITMMFYFTLIKYWYVNLYLKLAYWPPLSTAPLPTCQGVRALKPATAICRAPQSSNSHTRAFLPASLTTPHLTEAHHVSRLHTTSYSAPHSTLSLGRNAYMHICRQQFSRRNASTVDFEIICIWEIIVLGCLNSYLSYII